ncbi:MAG: bifunctional TVP38/TMEM64 family protein/FAD-dependent oxidoreductase [Wenzhouxiangellaceae bacterium]
MRIVVLLLVVAAIALFFWLDGPRWLSFDSLKSGLDELQRWRDAAPVQAMAIFVLVYVVITALSVPGAAVLTLAAGALFGLVWGTLLASVASSLGALLAFLIARYLLRDWVEARFGQRMSAIQDGIRRDGAWYLFSLRLVPVFPFFVINLLFGLTRMRAWTFFWTSQLGMLLGTVVYVNAGTQLAAIERPGDILSPSLLLSFALLALFPWLARALLRWFKRRRLYAPWSRPKRFDRNLIVIGAGAAGLVTAYIAATVRARVTLIEAHRMGGDCLNYGCVPSKALIKSARIAHQMRNADRWGLEPVQPEFSFRRVMARVHDAIAAIAPHDSVERYTALGVDVRRGHARLVDPWTVEITGDDGGKQRLTARSIVLATGAEPFVPPLPGLGTDDFLTSDTLWGRLKDREQAPGRLVVLGGGPIGCELAQALSRLGSRVLLVEMAPRLLTREDDEVSDFARATLESEGVEVLVGHQAVRVESEAGRRRLIVSGAGGERALDYDELLVAVGRKARLEGYGLESLGIAAERVIQTNAYLETIYPNIYAAGDVAGPYQFTHAAGHQAWHAAVNALFGRFKRFKVDYRAMPAVTFMDPEIARVGLNEREARAQGVSFEVTRYGLDHLDRAITEAEPHGWIKILTRPGRDRILGVTIVGAHAGELLDEFVLAMRHGLGLNKLLSVIHAYPTWSDANKLAAGEWKRAHAPDRLLRLLEVYHRWMRG